jgi:hypothetical protein
LRSTEQLQASITSITTFFFAQLCPLIAKAIQIWAI